MAKLWMAGAKAGRDTGNTWDIGNTDIAVHHSATLPSSTSKFPKFELSSVL